MGGDTGFSSPKSRQGVDVHNSSPLLDQLKGKPIGQMGQIPLFVAVAARDEQVSDWVAAHFIMEEVQKEAFRVVFRSSIVIGYKSFPPEFIRSYRPRQRQLRITRSPRQASAEGSEGLSGHVAVRGGGGWASISSSSIWRQIEEGTGGTG